MAGMVLGSMMAMTACLAGMNRRRGRVVVVRGGGFHHNHHHNVHIGGAHNLGAHHGPLGGHKHHGGGFGGGHRGGHRGGGRRR